MSATLGRARFPRIWRRASVWGRAPLALSTVLACAAGCGSSSDDAASGDDDAASGGEASSIGGTSSAVGGASATGGASSTSGGAASTGGALTSDGGSSLGASDDGAGGESEASAGGSGGESDGGGGAEETGSGGEFSGTCTESEAATANASGSGPYEVVIEVNSDPGINEGTIYRPADLGGDEKFPVFVWGEGACSRDGFSNQSAMVEIASHGYFVVADGTPNGSEGRQMDRNDMEAMGAPLVAYIDWALAENEKPCSVYYQSMEPAKVASNGFSCGGLMAQGTITDPRIVTWGVTSSGMAGAAPAFYDEVHTPVLFVEGGPDEVAYDGGLEGYQAIAQVGVPVLWFSKDLGHGGDLFTPNGGDFTKINLAWLNWQLKGDESATGKALLVGADCPYCSDNQWEVMSANLP